jgi:hypothetical protein
MTTIDDKFWHLKDMLHGLHVTATLLKDVDAVERTLLTGTRVRIVMMSRLGDVGITDKLGETGYCARVGGEALDGMQPRNPGNLDDLFKDITGMSGSFTVTQFLEGEKVTEHGPFPTTLHAAECIDNISDSPSVDYRTHFTMREDK